MKIILNILGASILGALVFLLLCAYLRRDKLGFLISPSTFFVPLFLAWASDMFFPMHGREIRDFIIGICGAQWVSSFIKELN